MPRPFLRPASLSEVFPYTDRAPLSRPLAPLWLSADVLERTTRCLITASFPDARALARLPGSPGDYELPFQTPKRPSRSPRTPSRRTVPFRLLHPLRSFDPRVNPCVSSRVASKRPPILSWVLVPLESSPSTPRILRPAFARGLRHAPALRRGPLPEPEDSNRRPQRNSGARRKGPLSPSRRVSPPQDTSAPPRPRRQLPTP